MALEKLITKVGADISGLTAGLKDAEKQINAYERNSTASLKNAALTVGNAAMSAFKIFSVAAGVAGTALIALSNRSRESIDALAKQADSLGLATEDMIAYQLAATMAGSSAEGMTRALTQLANGIHQTGSKTGPLINTLRELGLTSQELQRQGLSQSFETLVEKLSQVENPMQRVRMATELFGKEGRLLIPMLIEGANGLEDVRKRAEALGISLSRVDAAKIEMANDAIDQMKLAFTGVGNTLAISFAPAIKMAADAVTEVIVNNDGFRDSIAKGVELGVRGFGYLLLAINRLEMGFRAIQLTWTTVYLKIIEGINWVDEATKKAANSIRSVFGLEEIDTTAGLKAHADEVAGSVQDIVDRMNELQDTKPNVDGIVEEFERVKNKAQETAEKIAAMRNGTTGENNETSDIDADKEAQQRREAMENEFSDSLTEIWRDGLIRRQIFNKQSWDVQASDVAGSLTKMLGSVSTTSKSMFKLNQMAAIANAVINTAQGITKALAAYPPPLSFAMAAAQAAAGFAQVSAIKSATFGGGGGAATPSGGGAVAASSGAATNLTNPSQMAETTMAANNQGLRDVNISVQGFSITTDQLRDIITGINETIDDGARVGKLNVIGGTRGGA